MEGGKKNRLEIIKQGLRRGNYFSFPQNNADTTNNTIMMKTLIKW